MDSKRKPQRAALLEGLPGCGLVFREDSVVSEDDHVPSVLVGEFPIQGLCDASERKEGGSRVGVIRSTCVVRQDERAIRRQREERLEAHASPPRPLTASTAVRTAVGAPGHAAPSPPPRTAPSSIAAPARKAPPQSLSRTS